MDRRSFLRLAGATTFAIATAGCGQPPGLDARSLAQPELLAVLGVEGVRVIGAHYRDRHPDERDVTALRDAILAARPLSTRLLGAAGPSMSDLVRGDFAHGRTVIVDGWILSVTEARQCALFSLLAA
jgi:hypothetical protein